MKILHAYCLNYNIGDYALGIGLKNILRAHLDVDLIGNTNIQGRVFNEYYINEVVNKRYDLLVIGGGGIIHGSHWPNGWFWLIEKELIRTIKIPFIVYGVGNNYFEDERIPERAVGHLRETYKYANFFSVRNDGSYQRVLDQTGIDAKVVPDPGFHVGLNTDYRRVKKDPYVIVQLANDKPEKRFDGLSTADFIKSMRDVVSRLSKDYQVVLAPHVFDDVAVSKEVASGIKNCEVWDFGYYAFDHCNEAVGFYKHAEFAIAMRGHGQIVPIGFQVPVISLQNHPKHKGLMESLGLLEYNIDLREPNFKTELLHTIDKLVADKQDLQARYMDINRQIADGTNNNFLAIKKALGV